MINKDLENEKELFFKMLNSEDSDNDYDLNNCLISGDPLKINHITLNCNHKFNYFDLYNEVLKQKTKTNYLEIINLKINEIKCPYCRHITPNLLPYLDLEGVEMVKGVNCPSKFCLSLFKCDYKFKSGKRKNCSCGKDAWKFDNGWYCNNHLAIVNGNSQNKIEIEDEKYLEFISKTNLAGLRDQLFKNNLPKYGNKKILIERLIKNGIEINLNK